MPAKKKTVSNNTKWNDGLYIEIYELVKQGFSKVKIAELLGVQPLTLANWIRKKPALKQAIEKARQHHRGMNQVETFLDYVYNQLNPDLQRVWDQLSEFEDEENTVRKMELLERQPEKIRQHLFVHALVSCRFNPSEACRRVGISKAVFDRWVYTDPNFVALIDEILWHKKNYFEAALFGKVQEGDTTAIVFANRTQNKDRGYNTQTDVNISGSVVHGTVDLDRMNLPVHLKRQMLEAAREQLGVRAEPKMIEATEVVEED